MRKTTISRRNLIAGGLCVIPLGSLPIGREAKAADLTCVGPNAADANFRQSQHFTEKSPDPQKTCSACSFFRPGGEGKCGKCLIFDGPSNPAGRCDSWSKA